MMQPLPLVAAQHPACFIEPRPEEAVVTIRLRQATRRARLILLLAEGLPYRSIEERLDTTAPTISRWKDHFLRNRVAGLIERRHPGQKPFVINARAAG
jgi:hypothetical protein